VLADSGRCNHRSSKNALQGSLINPEKGWSLVDYCNEMALSAPSVICMKNILRRELVWQSIFAKILQYEIKKFVRSFYVPLILNIRMILLLTALFLVAYSRFNSFFLFQCKILSRLQGGRAGSFNLLIEKSPLPSSARA